MITSNAGRVSRTGQAGGAGTAEDLLRRPSGADDAPRNNSEFLYAGPRHPGALHPALESCPAPVQRQPEFVSQRAGIS